MIEKQVIFIRGIRVLFIIIFLLGLSGGCSTIPPNKEEPKKKITDGVVFFRDLRQIDLDKDGEKEIIAIYAASLNSSGVKVIKFDKGRGNVIFERVFNTPNTGFEMKKGIPIITFEEIDQVAGSRFNGAYRWDGEAFILEQK